MSAIEARCGHCGMFGHSGVCPRIESIEYYPNGTVRSVRYRATGATSDIPIDVRINGRAVGQVIAGEQAKAARS